MLIARMPLGLQAHLRFCEHCLGHHTGSRLRYLAEVRQRQRLRYRVPRAGDVPYRAVRDYLHEEGVNPA